MDVNAHLPLFRALQQLESAYADREREGEREPMGPEDTRYLHRWLLDFRRNGMALSEEDREKVIQRKKRESELCIDFQKHLNEDTSSHSFLRSELAGLPADFIAALETEKNDDGADGEGESDGERQGDRETERNIEGEREKKKKREEEREREERENLQFD